MLALVSIFLMDNPVINHFSFSEPSKTRVVKTIVEEVVNGKIVSSQVKSVEERATKWAARKTEEGTYQRMHEGGIQADENFQEPEIQLHLGGFLKIRVLAGGMGTQYAFF